LLVNPHDPGEMADAMRQALAMPHEERRARYLRMWTVLCASDIEGWRMRYLDDLRSVRGPGVQTPPAVQPGSRLRQRQVKEDGLLLKEHYS